MVHKKVGRFKSKKDREEYLAGFRSGRRGDLIPLVAKTSKKFNEGYQSGYRQRLKKLEAKAKKGGVREKIKAFVG